jgi:hypothetical protein
LASRNLAFRGHRETSLDAIENSGNFLNWMKVISKYDPVLQDLYRMNVNVIRDQYLSHEMQNELILLVAKKVKEKIVNKTIFYHIVGLH